MEKGNSSSGRALGYAYVLLKERPRSEAELRARLKLKGYGEPETSAVITALKKNGEVDDVRFARVWIESRMHRNPVGDLVLRQELREKGVDESIVEEAIARKGASYDERTVALVIGRERYGQLKGIDKSRAMKRLYDYLARRGFRFDTIEAVIDDVVKGRRGEDGDQQD